jgi:3-hydroxyisobutyryl-CoA hydrolase
MPFPQALYLGLTGTRITEPSDLIALGLATHYVPSESLETLQKLLLSQDFTPQKAAESLADCVATHAAKPPEAPDSLSITASQELIKEAMQPAVNAMQSEKGCVAAVVEVLAGLDSMVCCCTHSSAVLAGKLL